MFTLSRFFSIASLIVIILISLTLGWFYRATAVDALLHLEKSKDIALTRAFGDSLWPEISDYMAFSVGRDAQELAASPEYASLLDLLRSQAIYVNAVNIKIYDQSGRTVFSAVNEQIGQLQINNPGVIQALSGEVSTELTHKDRLNSFDGVYEDRHVLGAYVPLFRAQTSEIHGVFELYTDVTPLILHINLVTGRIFVFVTLILATLYAALLGIVRYAEGILRKQYQERINAETSLRQRLLLEEQISAISLQMANAMPNQIGQGIQDALAELGTTLNAEYSFAYTLFDPQSEAWSGIPTGTSTTYLWNSPDAPEISAALPDEEFSVWLTNRLSSGKDMVILARSDLAPYLGQGHPLIHALGVEQLMLIPLRCNGVVSGFLGLASRNADCWTASQELDSFASMLASIFATSLARMQAGMELAASQEQLTHIISSSPAIIYARQATAPYHLTFVSATIVDTLYYTPEQLRQDRKFWSMCVHPEDADNVMLHTHSVQHEGIGTIEYRVRDGNGDWHWLRDEARVSLRDGGIPVEIIGSWSDITDSKRAEAAIYRHNEYLQTLHSVTLAVMNRADSGKLSADILREALVQAGADTGMIGLLTPDYRSIQIQASIRARQEMPHLDTVVAIDAPPQQALPFIQVAPPDELSCWSQGWLAHLDVNTHTVVEAALLRGDRVIGILTLANTQSAEPFPSDVRELAHHFATLASLVLDNTQLYASWRDEINERWQAETSLSLSEERFHTLIQSMNDTVFTIDQEGRFSAVYGNSTEAKLLRAQNVIGLSPDEIWIAAVAEIHSASHRLALHGQHVVYEWTVDDHPGGEAAYHQTSLSPIRDPNGRVTGLVGVSRNITALRNAEHAKADFVANVSHELRTPLASILGYTEVLLTGRPGELTETQTEFLNTVFESGSRLKAMVDDLLNVSHLESGNFRLTFDNVDVADLAQDAILAIQPVAAKSDVRLELAPSGFLPHIEADKERLHQVIDNLLSNGVKFTKPGGQVTLTLIPEQAHLCIVVRDTGIGIDEHDMAVLFTRFQRGRHASVNQSRGTGLGLFLAKAIVEGHNGSIQVESQLHQGTTFWVRLPYTQKSPAEENPGALIAEITDRYFRPSSTTPAIR